MKIRKIHNNTNSVPLQGLGVNSPLGVGGRSGGTFWVLVKLSFRSLIGNGLKTWLIVFVLSFTFVLIIFMQGLLEGWSRQAVTDAINWEIAGGQYWNKKYDPYDPFTIDSSAAVLPQILQKQYGAHQIEPILIAQGTIYPGGRMQGVLLKGIRPDQKLLDLPTQVLKTSENEVPILIGTNMARQANLKINDLITLRWRDIHGTFEAIDVRVAGIFKAAVPTIDNGQIWLPLEKLQQMMQQPDESTIIVKSQDIKTLEIKGFVFKDSKELTKQIIALVEAKSGGMAIFYFIFLMLAMIAIFDTQTLSIFRRQREIGTFVALGMTQRQVVWLFTLEGTMNAVFAILLAAIWGSPILIWLANVGIKFPVDTSNMGIAMADVMIPYFSLKLIFGTIAFILIITALVSYLPARRIAKMNPTDAIRGRVN